MSRFPILMQYGELIIFQKNYARVKLVIHMSRINIP